MGAQTESEPRGTRSHPITRLAAEPGSDPILEGFTGILCFTCRMRPAGFGSWYRHSAYCAHCQPMPNMGEAAPYGSSRGKWVRQLESNREEILASR